MDHASISLSTTSPTDGMLLGAPVIDVDGTFFIQLGIFITLILILHPLLFKPWLEALARRSEAIEGAASKAKKLQRDAADLVKDYETGVAEARDKAFGERATLRKAVETEQAGRVAEEREAALTKLTDDRAAIKKQAADARASLQGKVDELASEIATRVLGRAS